MRGRPKRSVDVEIVCKRCGKTKTIPAWQKYGRNYCSQDCFHEAYRGRVRGGSAATEKTCTTCGEVFLVGGEGNPRRAQRYCSRKCYGQSLAYLSPAKTMTEVEAAWLAGLFDGEGSIIFTKKKSVYVRITISNTVKILLDKVQEVSGTGAIVVSHRSNPKHSQGYWWQSYGGNALILLRQMLPWLIVKREKALRALGESP